MDNFLRNNNDFAYHTIGAENKAEKPPIIPAAVNPKPYKNRLGTVVIACFLAMVIGLGGGTGGAFLATRIMDETPRSAERENNGGGSDAPQIGTPDVVNAASDQPKSESIFLDVEGDTLVVNTNTTLLTPEELFEAVSDGVVGIEITLIGAGRFGVPSEPQLVGSGFVFTTDGYVITNHHVIEDAEDVTVVVNDYDDPEKILRYPAKIVGSDRSTDIAILKITRDEEFRALAIGDSSTLKVGTFVCPIGFPLGLEKSMTYGIVSGLNREFEDGGYELAAIQFDAAVNPGNSGGPLFDLYGNVVGIVNKKLVFENLGDNIGLAITINDAKPIINDLLMYGTVVSRAKLGISTVVLNEFTAAQFEIDITEGIFVQSIFPGAPAAKSDLARGDIIIAINGVSVASITDVQAQIKNKRPGDTVELTVIRIGETGNHKKVNIQLILASEADMEE